MIQIAETQVAETSDTLTMVNTRKIRQIVGQFLCDAYEFGAGECRCRHCGCVKTAGLDPAHDAECPVMYGRRVMEGTE